ncbi:endonuclease/exonuclease/phosphatase family protein [Fibrella aquatica]|uniref:endonuclease/exonuclease/phosphatase family protein n=1 Tax=Fibrella aquatica TaxID=3242487 RepID=UPI003522A464
MSLQTRIGQFLAFMGRSLIWSLHLGVFFYTLLIYYLLGWLPLEHWLASMVMITLPIAWLLLVLLGIFWLFSRPWRSTLSALGLLLGYWLLPRTLAIHSASTDPQQATAFSILSYNVSVFNLETYYKDELKKTPKKSIALTNWILQHQAGVKCFQEFYTGNQSPTFQMLPRLEKAGYRYHAFLQPVETGYIGVATFSKYPIVDQGRHLFSSFNGMVWTDLNVDGDTIRVINVHLQSMGIRVRRVLQENKMSGVKAETRSVLGALKAGFKARQGEVRFVEACIEESPYPVIVTGDFNDTPYSVVYERLHRVLPNAFEDAGHGFGFTLNRAPRTIRIDNQFYDPRFQVIDFETHHDQPHSDHFPITGTYRVK